MGLVFLASPSLASSGYCRRRRQSVGICPRHQTLSARGEIGMSNNIIIPPEIAKTLRQHLFQNELEQGAFLFAEAKHENGALNLITADCYLVPASGWEVQMEVYLQMKDSERAKIMKLAREKSLCA